MSPRKILSRAAFYIFAGNDFAMKLRRLTQCFQLLEGGYVSQTVDEKRMLRIFAVPNYGNPVFLFPIADGYSSEWIPAGDYIELVAQAQLVKFPSPELTRDPKPVIRYRETNFGDGVVLAALVPMKRSMALVYEI